MKRIIALLLAVVFVLLGCSCSQQNGEKEIKIGIAAPDVTHGWVAGIAYYAEKYCEDNNITYKIITSSDAAEMSASINDLVAWGASAVVVAPQWSGMESTVKEITEAGTPVVAFDFDIDVDGIYKVTGDNYGMGQKSAEQIASVLSSGASIALLDVPTAGSVASLRKQGFYDALKAAGFDASGVFEIQCSVMTREEGLKQMSDILSAHPNVDAVFSIDDELSIGCVQAITEAGRTDVKCITGGGGMQEYFRMIDDEKYADMGLCTALYSPMMIQDAIRTAISVSSGETPEKQQTISTVLVTDKNVADYLDSANTVY